MVSSFQREICCNAKAFLSMGGGSLPAVSFMSFAQSYLKQVEQVAKTIDVGAIEAMVEEIVTLREAGGRLFFVGVGGSASNASHCVNDFRKLCGVECYAPTDNVAELSARINDEGWESCFAEFLRGSYFNNKDGLFVLSVGGGHLEKKISLNIVAALRYAKETGGKIFGIVGRDGGFTKKVADHCIVVPTVDPSLVTFHAEAFQSILCHLLVAHPKMKRVLTKWESI